MVKGVKTMCRRLYHWPRGRRFQYFHREYAGSYGGWRKCWLIAAASVSFVIGVILAFIPGPAVVFFALTCALLAALSNPVARRFDAIELWCWRVVLRWKRRRSRRQYDSARTPKLRPHP
ncbi:MAG: hypothetical protein ABW321_04540 [Polyangiales bacterium]